METILCLGFVESDGSLGKAALESLSLTSSIQNQLGDASLAVGLVGESCAVRFRISWEMRPWRWVWWVKAVPLP
jgi:hypothetical protein